MIWRLYRVRGAVEPRLYIGITSLRAPYGRLQQHVGDVAGNIASGRRVAPKWWAVLATGWDLDPAVYATRADAEAAEARAIRVERPRCNVMHNQGNPHRWRSMADVPLEQRPVDEPAPPRAQHPMRQPARPEVRHGYMAAIIMVVAVWLVALYEVDTVTHDIRAAVMLTAVPFAITWSRTKRRRRRPAPARRKAPALR